MITITKDFKDYLSSEDYLNHLGLLGINATESAATIYSSCDNPNKEITITLYPDSVEYTWLDSKGFKVSHIITSRTNRLTYFS